MAIMEDIFKTKEGDREKEIDRFQKTLAVFENGNYRTTGLNEAVTLIGLFQNGLGE